LPNSFFLLAVYLYSFMALVIIHNSFVTLWFAIFL
jgi:hypothetical protein